MVSDWISEGNLRGHDTRHSSIGRRHEAPFWRQLTTKNNEAASTKKTKKQMFMLIMWFSLKLYSKNPILKIDLLRNEKLKYFKIKFVLFITINLTKTNIVFWVKQI